MQLLWQDVEVAEDNEWGAILRKAAEEGIHLVVEVTEGTWRTVDHHNGELDRNGDSDSVEFKRRSGTSVLVEGPGRTTWAR